MTTRPLTQVRISIVGLGLMGGSLALALRGKCAEIIGIDIDEETRHQAVKQGVVDVVSDDFAEAVARADLVVLATPVKTILSLLNHFKSLPTGNTSPLTIIDLGSTKNEITEAMASLPSHFDPIGGHPMCGKETAGLVQAEPELFVGTTFAMTPLERTSRHAMTLAHELVKAVGARALILDPVRHDNLVATTSHMPYLAACSLITVVSDLAKTDDAAWTMAASGFRDATRLAASDTTVMLDILRTNREAVRAALKKTRAALDRIDALMVEDSDGLKTALQSIQSERIRHLSR